MMNSMIDTSTDNSEINESFQPRSSMRNHFRKRLWVIFGLFFMILTIGCAAQRKAIPGTNIPDNKPTRQVIDAVEQYRLAVERKDVPALLLMASPDYWQPGDAPTGADSYGHETLNRVLSERFQRVSDIRYSVRYMQVSWSPRCRDDGKIDIKGGCRASVEVLIDASFSAVDAVGNELRRALRDQNQFVLEWTGKKWVFLSGM